MGRLFSLLILVATVTGAIAGTAKKTVQVPIAAALAG
jgi:hypothetical protein